MLLHSPLPVLSFSICGPGGRRPPSQVAVQIPSEVTVKGQAEGLGGRGEECPAPSPLLSFPSNQLTLKTKQSRTRSHVSRAGLELPV